MRRYVARIGSALALIVAAILGIAVSATARADAPLRYLFDGRPYVFTHTIDMGDDVAIGMEDPALRRLLRALGAVVTWHAGQRYVLVTTAQPVVVSFVAGDARYDVGAVHAQAPFIPFLRDGEAFVPFGVLMRALDLRPIRDGDLRLLQPQLATLDVRQTDARVEIVAYGAVPLHPHLVRDDGTERVYAFPGVGTSLAGLRDHPAPGIERMLISVRGGARHPETIVAVTLAAGTHAEEPASDDGRDAVLAFVSPPGAGQSGPPITPVAARAPALPSAEAGVPAAPEATDDSAPTVLSPGPTSSPASLASVTAITASPAPDGYLVHVAVAGPVTYEWHRTRAPDDRFWLDLDGAWLQGRPVDVMGSGPVLEVRAAQFEPTVVRVALSLDGEKSVDVRPDVDGNGVTITVSASDAAAFAPYAGSGALGGAVAAASPGASTTPWNGTWPFMPTSTPFPAAPPAPTNPDLIVIDPGHGGSDQGAVHDGVAEATLTLDMAKRLRAILRKEGWQVILTRTRDVDVYEPNDSARDELQARVNVAEENGARIFISIHCNSYINPGPSGTTTYYSKAIDVPLARDIQQALIARLGTKDDGIVKSRLYVTSHTTMPAVLVETAFLSNPGDFAKLTDPAWREEVARGIAAGVARYAGPPPPPNQDPPQ